MNGESDGQEERERQAIFMGAGLALYLGNSVEQALINLLVLGGVTRETIPATLEDVELAFHEHAKKTLGRLVSRLGADTDISGIDEVLERRNHLAHHFFTKRAIHFMSAPGRSLMLQELIEMHRLFEDADTQIKELVARHLEHLGIDEAANEQARNELLEELPNLN